MTEFLTDRLPVRLPGDDLKRWVAAIMVAFEVSRFENIMLSKKRHPELVSGSPQVAKVLGRF